MSPIRRRDLSLIPQTVSAASEDITQPIAAFLERRAAAGRDAAPGARRAIRETIVGVGSGAEAASRPNGFDRSLRDTRVFGTPALSSVAAASAASSAPTARSREPERPREPERSREPERVEPPVVARPRRAAAAPTLVEVQEQLPLPPVARVAEPAPGPEPEAAPPVSAELPEEASAERGGLFRTAALDAQRADAIDPGLGVKPEGRTWSVLLLLLSMLLLSFVGAAFASVEVTAEALGVLRAPNGLRPVATVLGGSVTEVLVQSGDAVEAGQVVARLESTELRASLESRQRELALVRDDVARSERHDEALEAESARALSRRRAALRERLDVNAQRLEQRRERDADLVGLVREGGASVAEGMAAKEALQDAAEVVSTLGNELAVLDLEIADRARQSQERESARRTQIGRAETSVAEAQTLLAATEIRAPAAGRIESLAIAPGAVLAAGGVLGNIVPSGAPRTITGFVPSREIAFVQPGAPATIEVSSLSVSEFGLAKARVTRVSSDVATAAEVQAALSQPINEPLVRVELELIDTDASQKMTPLLRSGERVTIRLHRRERRLITLLFDFVRRWVA